MLPIESFTASITRREWFQYPDFGMPHDCFSTRENRPNKALHLIGNLPALRPSSRSLPLMKTSSQSGPAGELGRYVPINHQIEL